MLISFFIFTCCRACCNGCGHKKYQKSSEARSCWKWVNYTFLTVSVVLIFIGLVFSYYTNEYISDVVDYVPEATIEIIDTVSLYVGGMSNQLGYMTNSFLAVYASTSDTLLSIGDSFVQ